MSHSSEKAWQLHRNEIKRWAVFGDPSLVHFFNENTHKIACALYLNHLYV